MSYWIRRFELPTVRVKGFSEGWGIIIIDSKGLLSVYSDFGNYLYHWSDFGGDFPKFLLRLDEGYLAGKLGKRPVYDTDATRRAIEEYLVETVKEGDLTEVAAEEERERIKACGNLHSSEDFGEWLRETVLEDAYEFSRTMMNPQLRGFLDHIWPRFTALLQANQPKPARKLFRHRRSVRQPLLRPQVTPPALLVRG